MNMVLPITAADQVRAGTGRPLVPEVEHYSTVQTDDGDLTTFEDWVSAARQGHLGYRFVLDHEDSIKTGDLDAIVSACGDVPSGP